MIALFLSPDQFQEGDIIFSSSKYVGYKIEKITSETFDLIEFSNGKKRQFTAKKNYFAPIIFSVCRKE
ncbi:hypothetical protein KKE60_05515 [Patescibacteria group bacterium]|nr:hypothetical protein [Patescibacteria group bacterium]